MFVCIAFQRLPRSFLEQRDLKSSMMLLVTPSCALIIMSGIMSICYRWLLHWKRRCLFWAWYARFEDHSRPHWPLPDGRAWKNLSGHLLRLLHRCRIYQPYYLGLLCWFLRRIIFFKPYLCRGANRNEIKSAQSGGVGDPPKFFKPYMFQGADRNEIKPAERGSFFSNDSRRSELG
jgi:hypothetical protein